MSRRGGFTLVEVLVAMAFVAVLTPVIVQALRVCSSASTAAERGAIATQLAQNKLAELMIDDAWSSGANQGDFGEDWPNYRWQAETTDWTQASGMTEITVIVTYSVQGTERTAEVSTLAQTDPEAATP